MVREAVADAQLGVASIDGTPSTDIKVAKATLRTRRELSEDESKRVAWLVWLQANLTRAFGWLVALMVFGFLMWMMSAGEPHATFSQVDFSRRTVPADQIHPVDNLFLERDGALWIQTLLVLMAENGGNAPYACMHQLQTSDPRDNSSSSGVHRAPARRVCALRATHGSSERPRLLANMQILDRSGRRKTLHLTSQVCRDAEPLVVSFSETVTALSLGAERSVELHGNQAYSAQAIELDYIGEGFEC